MKDPEIRAAFLGKLGRKYVNDPETIIIEELGLCQGEARIDIAVVNGSMHGYEIKSDQDTLKRLPGQILTYNRVLDYVTIIVSSLHLESALKIIPDWWGILEARRNKSSEQIKFHKIRCVKKNLNLDAEAIVQLIWKDEAIRILRNRELHKGYLNKTKWILWEKIIEEIPINELKKEIRTIIKSRENWRFDQKPK